MKSLIEDLRNELKANADEKTRTGSKRFFKEHVDVYGVNSWLVHKISKAHFNKLESKNKAEVFDLCEILWQSGKLEETFVACNWSYAMRDEYEPKDFDTFKHWIGTYVNNWASCDTLCNHTVGSFLARYPEYVQELKEFTSSENRWMRRAAAVSLIVPVREGMFLDEVFEIANRLMNDKDDLVQKGYGWLLKVAAKHREQEVFEFVVASKQIMPRTALRYAIEKMPKEKRAQAMAR